MSGDVNFFKVQLVAALKSIILPYFEPFVFGCKAEIQKMVAQSYSIIHLTHLKKSLELASLFNKLDLVAVVRYKGSPSFGGCIFSAPVWLLRSSPMAVMYEPSRSISSMVWRPRCRTPEKKPQTWSMTPGDIGSNLSEITSMSERN